MRTRTSDLAIFQASHVNRAMNPGMYSQFGNKQGTSSRWHKGPPSPRALISQHQRRRQLSSDDSRRSTIDSRRRIGPYEMPEECSNVSPTMPYTHYDANKANECFPDWKSDCFARQAAVILLRCIPTPILDLATRHQDHAHPTIVSLLSCPDPPWGPRMIHHRHAIVGVCYCMPAIKETRLVINRLPG